MLLYVLSFLVCCYGVMGGCQVVASVFYMVTRVFRWMLECVYVVFSVYRLLLVCF